MNDFDEFEGPDESAGEGLELDRVWSMVRRRWRIFAIGFLITVGPAIAPALLAKPWFEATARITIEASPEVMQFGASVLPEQRFLDRRRAFESLVAVILSDRVLGDVVDRTPPAPEQPPGALGRLKNWIRELRDEPPPPPLSPELERQFRIEWLRANTRLQDVAGGSIVSITVGDPDAGRGTAMANAIADAYVRYERDQKHAASRQALTWLRQRSAEVRERILGQQEAIAQLARNLGPDAGLEGAADNRMRELLDSLQTARLELLALDQRMSELEPAARAIGRRPEAGNPLVRDQYNAAVLALSKARLDLTANHPELRRLEQAVEALREQLPEGPQGTDPLALDRAREYDRIRSQRRLLGAQVASLERQLEGAGTDPEKSTEIARYHRLQRELELDHELLVTIQRRISSTVLTASQEMGQARVLDYAILPSGSRSHTKWLIAGLSAAMLAGLGLAGVVEILDRAEYSPDRAAALLNTSVLAKIPAVDPEVARTPRAALESTTPLGESYRKLRTSLIYAGVGQEIRSLVVASAVASEGKTTTAVSLASSFAGVGRRTILIDGDMRRPRVDYVTGTPRSPGLSEILQGRAKVEEVIRKPRTFGADVIPSGEVPDNPTDLLSSPAAASLVAQLAGEYDLVIIDAPVLLAVSDALILASIADGTVLVNRPGAVDRRAFRQAAEDLRRARANVIGMVASQVKMGDPHSYPSYLASPYVSGRRPLWKRLLGWS